jgi:hypothetical protein
MQNEKNNIREVENLLAFYEKECDPEPILAMQFPENKLQYNDEELRELLAYTPLFTTDEKTTIIEQLPYLKQDEFDEIIDDILKTHAKLKVQLEKFALLVTDKSQKDQLDGMINHL